MEPPLCEPHCSPHLALKLIGTPPGAIPETDPLLFGREVVQKQQKQLLQLGRAAAPAADPHPASPGNAPARHPEAGPRSAPPPPAPEAPPAAAAAAPGAACGGGGGGGSGSYRQLPSRDAATLSYDEFVAEFMAPNRPVVLRGATASWRASREWRDARGGLALEALERVAGHCSVCVTDTSNQDDGCGDVRTTTLSDYLDWWRRNAAARQQPPGPGPGGSDSGCGSGAGCSGPSGGGDGTSSSRGAAPGGGCAAEGPRGAGDGTAAGGCSAAAPGRLLYLKDWHFTAECPHHAAYRLPVFFADDWLNQFYDAQARAAPPPPPAAPTAPAAAPEGEAEAAAPPAAGPQPAAAAAAAPPAPLADAQGGQARAHEETVAVAGLAAVALSAAPEAGWAGQVQAGAGLQANPASAPTPTPAPAASNPAPAPTPAPSAPAPPSAPATTRDYRFLYLGPAGTWSPLHSDVLRSHSWSANVAGRKRWLLLPPAHTHLLYDARGVRMAPHLELGRVGTGCSEAEFPGLREARALAYEFIQEPGDAVFVPSGWHHCVENLADTLSLNHNWVNGHNAHWTWALLRRQHVDAAEAIADCRELCAPDEFEGLVQGTLDANSGLTWGGFVELLGCVVGAAEGRLRQLLGPRRGRAGEEQQGQPQGAGAGAGATERTAERCGAGRQLQSVGAREEERQQQPLCGGAQQAGVEGEGRWGAGVCKQLLAGPDGPEAAHCLFVMQRAGLVLRDVCASFQQLVLGPAEKHSRQRRGAHGPTVDDAAEAMARLARSRASGCEEARQLLAAVRPWLGAVAPDQWAAEEEQR